MQFLVYLTVLMVSVSTVLLEIHWLTTPPPQSKPATQIAAAPQPRPKVDGPNAELSPVYPRKVEPAQPAPNAAAAANTTAKAEAIQKSAAETTGASGRAGEASKPMTDAGAISPNSAENAGAYAPQPPQGEAKASSDNRCDIQACASAYKSFNAADCTYQPFDGPRRVCNRAPEQRAARVQSEEAQGRAGNRYEDSREADRRTRWRVYDEDDDDPNDMFLFRRSRRW